MHSDLVTLEETFNVLELNRRNPSIDDNLNLVPQIMNKLEYYMKCFFNVVIHGVSEISLTTYFK